MSGIALATGSGMAGVTGGQAAGAAPPTCHLAPWNRLAALRLRVSRGRSVASGWVALRWRQAGRTCKSLTYVPSRGKTRPRGIVACWRAGRCHPPARAAAIGAHAARLPDRSPRSGPTRSLRRDPAMKSPRPVPLWVRADDRTTSLAFRLDSLAWGPVRAKAMAQENKAARESWQQIVRAVERNRQGAPSVASPEPAAREVDPRSVEAAVDLRWWPPATWCETRVPRKRTRSTWRARRDRSR